MSDIYDLARESPFLLEEIKEGWDLYQRFPGATWGAYCSTVGSLGGHDLLYTLYKMAYILGVTL